MNRSGLYLTVVAITLFALGVGGLNFLYRLRVKPGLDSQISAQNRFKSLYQEDQAYLAKNGTELSLGASGGTSDAGPFLNPIVRWTPMPANSKQTAIVDEPTRVALLRTGNDWILQIAKGHHPKVDLSFFSQLSKYDNWDIERGSPIADLIEKNVFVPPTRLPLPDTSDLLSAVKLRLIAGGLDHQFVPALKDARLLGRLLLTTENIQLVLAGLLVLDFERRADRYYVDNLKMNAQTWTPIDANITRRARRAVLATRAYLRLWTPSATLQEVFMGDSTPPGLCAAINEGLPFDYSLREVLEPHWPFEMDTRAEYARLDRVFLKAQASCRLRYLSALTKDSSLKIHVPGPLIFNDLPYSRKIFGLRLSAADLGGFEDYSKQMGHDPSAD
jgi:hypothetical protein